MIDVYDAYDSSGVTDVIVFASGTIESPNITKIVKIDLANDIDIEIKRSNLHAAERKGIRRTSGEVFIYYNKSDFIGRRGNQRDSAKGIRDNNRLDTKRSGSETKANRIVEFRIDEKKGTITTTYANGETVTESLNSGKASQDLDFFDYLNENAEDAEISEMNTGFLSSLKGEVEASRKDARGPPAQKNGVGKASREYWYPKLTNQEWSLLNRTMNRELTGSKNYIDEATKWLYAEERA